LNPSRRIALPLTLLLGTAAVLLGYIGYEEVDSQAGFGDTAYQAVQLLALQYSGPPNPDWELEAARWLSALAIGMALISVLAVLAREQADRLMTRMFSRGHVVVVGLKDRGIAVASALEESGQAVVAIESDEVEKRRVPGAGRLAVIDRDPRDRESYREAAASRARHVFIAPGDDSANLQALDACLAEIGETGPSVHVAIDGQLLWRELHRSSLTWAGRGIAIEFISLPDRIGARLVEEMAQNLSRGPIIVWGAGPKAMRTAVHAVRWTLMDGREPELLLAGPEATQLEAALLKSEPWIAERASVRSVPEPVDAAAGTAFVVGLPHAEVLAGASTLAEMLEGTAIVADLATAKGTQALRRSGFRTDPVSLVEAEAQVLGPGLFEGSTRELIARAKHVDYLAKDFERGVTVEENPSLVPWEELPEPLRESNRRFAESVGRKLVELEAELAPLTGPHPRPSDLMTDRVIEDLARSEHDRWREDLSRDGWKRTNGEKSVDLKLHPMLVDWAELPEPEREKDRDAIRILPQALARVGYEIRKRVNQF
jgi:TrkA-N domain/RyR domain